jgi:FkbM family methyltransferase
MISYLKSIKRKYFGKYSQNDEEIRILRYFDGFVGTFLDLGANDGKTLSNTYRLAEKGWKGTLVEASPTVFKRLKANLGSNPNMQLLNYAAGDKDGEAVLHDSGELMGMGDTGLVSTINESELEKWTPETMKFNKFIVPVRTFDTILKESKIKEFDFISIDIEGCEEIVVPQMNFPKLGAKMVIIEASGEREDFFNKIMSASGFRLVHKNAENLFYQLQK